MEAMSKALTEMVVDGRATVSEREERARQYMAQLEAQRERWRTEGLAKGRAEGLAKGREALLDLAGSLVPESAESLRSIEDLAELQKAVKRLLAGGVPEG